jgi:four helix bundle protein
MKRYEDLKIWQKSYQLTLDVYRETRQFPREEQYGLVSQMRRASSSIVANIAEGSLRASRKEFLQFLHLSLGSLGELETFLRLSMDLKYITADTHRLLAEKCDELFRMFNSFIGVNRGFIKVAANLSLAIFSYHWLSLAIT